MMVGLVRINPRRDERGLVWRVGEFWPLGVLRVEREATVRGVEVLAGVVVLGAINIGFDILHLG